MAREDIKARIKELSEARFPNEACGFVMERPGKRMEVVECENVHARPQEFFAIKGDEWAKVEDQAGSRIACVWHSHPNGHAEANDFDKTCSEDLEVPYLIYALPADLWDYYEPTGYMAPLYGRPFLHGVLDCYSCVRDYYRTVVGITLPNFNRADKWWEDKSKPDLFLKNFESAGFTRVYDLQKRDGILMALNNGVVNHCGVYLGNCMMLHHATDRPSRNVPYNPGSSAFYVKMTTMYVRHKSQFTSSVSVN